MYIMLYNPDANSPSLLSFFITIQNYKVTDISSHHQIRIVISLSPPFAGKMIKSTLACYYLDC